MKLNWKNFKNYWKFKKSQNQKVAETQRWDTWSGFFYMVVLLCAFARCSLKWNWIEKNFNNSWKLKSHQVKKSQKHKAGTWYISLFFWGAVYTNTVVRGDILQIFINQSTREAPELCSINLSIVKISELCLINQSIYSGDTGAVLNQFINLLWRHQTCDKSINLLRRHRSYV